jgi:ubiquitin carboxyl-terminal hydrolase 9/24
LKNAGATCYMNSVLQQLFMTKSLREKIFSVQLPSTTSVDEFDDDGSLFNMSATIGPVSENNNNSTSTADNPHNDRSKSVDEAPKTDEDLRKEYNISIMKNIQIIFGHLVESQMQYHIPKGFWREFRLFGERVNLREQHDAIEFYNSVIDCLDESCKALQVPQICTQILGGTFADQKICKDCPHRYTREESFTLLSIDVKHSQRLTESLEQYVKGDLLEGPNAYYCEKCDKKIDTIKRTCIKKLPNVLVIQLKRFDYDWERETAVKSNEYFEFPRDLDMRPYTVQGIAAAETDHVQVDPFAATTTDPNQDCQYKLVGIVVHSGQANGGHYYSYIQDKSDIDNEYHWYKFDDGDVSECKMDDEEMKNQCYGGDYTGEVYDSIIKRMAFKKQKRWWNAYILFYEKTGCVGEETRIGQPISIPLGIHRIVQKKNLKFLHYRNHFSIEYFQFIRKLSQCTLQYCAQQQLTADDVASCAIAEHDVDPNIELLCLLNMKLIVKFLFNVCFRVKKTLRGPINEWHDTLYTYFKYSAKIREWFANFLLDENQHLISQYLIECPSSDIRLIFCKILVLYAHLCHNAGTLPLAIQMRVDGRLCCVDVGDAIINIILGLLKRDFVDQGKHYVQYFQFFYHYASLGLNECLHLVKLNVPLVFIQYVCDESMSSVARQQQTSDLVKLYSVVATLLRCYDVNLNSLTTTVRVFLSFVLFVCLMYSGINKQLGSNGLLFYSNIGKEKNSCKVCLTQEVMHQCF